MRRIVSTSLLSLVLISTLSGCGLFGKKKNAEVSGEYPTAYQEPAPATAGSYPTQPSYDAYNAGAGANAYPAAGGGRTHVVQKKDTLFSLARMYYSDQSKWRDIYEANRGEIADPNKIRVGQKLTIP